MHSVSMGHQELTTSPKEIQKKWFYISKEEDGVVQKIYHLPLRAAIKGVREALEAQLIIQVQCKGVDFYLTKTTTPSRIGLRFTWSIAMVPDIKAPNHNPSTTKAPSFTSEARTWRSGSSTPSNSRSSCSARWRTSWWAEGLQGDWLPFYGQTTWRIIRRSPRSGLLLIRVYFWTTQMLKQRIISIELNLKCCLSCRMLRLTHQPQNVWQNILLRNTYVCSLKTFMSSLDLLYSQFNPNMTHGHCQTLWGYHVIKTQIYQNAHPSKCRRLRIIIVLRKTYYSKS